MRGPGTPQHRPGHPAARLCQPHTTLPLAGGTPVEVVPEWLAHANAAITLTVTGTGTPAWAARPPTAARPRSTADRGEGVSDRYREARPTPDTNTPQAPDL